MAQKQKPLKLGSKTKVIPIKKQRNKRVPTSYEFSLSAVQRAAETLKAFGFTYEEAYKSLATQLHESLLGIKRGAK